MSDVISRYINNRIEQASKRIMLDVGCGSHKEPGWLGMDALAGPGVDIVHNMLDIPWPFEDESVWHVRLFHVLEHIPMTCACCADRFDPLLQTFEELWRILVPDGRARIVSPHSSNTLRAWRDPTHRRLINEETFLYANRARRQEFGVDHYPMKCNFDMTYGFVYDVHGQIQDVHAELIKGAS
jgi:hypothetical protein